MSNQSTSTRHEIDEAKALVVVDSLALPTLLSALFGANKPNDVAKLSAFINQAFQQDAIALTNSDAAVVGAIPQVFTRDHGVLANLIEEFFKEIVTALTLTPAYVENIVGFTVLKNARTVIVHIDQEDLP